MAFEVHRLLRRLGCAVAEAKVEVARQVIRIQHRLSWLDRSRLREWSAKHILDVQLGGRIRPLLLHLVKVLEVFVRHRWALELLCVLSNLADISSHVRCAHVLVLAPAAHCHRLAKIGTRIRICARMRQERRAAAASPLGRVVCVLALASWRVLRHLPLQAVQLSTCRARLVNNVSPLLAPLEVQQLHAGGRQSLLLFGCSRPHGSLGKWERPAHRLARVISRLLVPIPAIVRAVARPAPLVALPLEAYRRLDVAWRRPAAASVAPCGRRPLFSVVPYRALNVLERPRAVQGVVLLVHH